MSGQITPFSLFPTELLQLNLTETELRVLVALYSFRAKNTDTVWPSLPTLAVRAGVKDKTRISKITTRLAEKGCLEKHKSGFKGNNKYKLIVPDSCDTSTNLDESANIEKAGALEVNKHAGSGEAKSANLDESANIGEGQDKTANLDESTNIDEKPRNQSMLADSSNIDESAKSNLDESANLNKHTNEHIFNNNNISDHDDYEKFRIEVGWKPRERILDQLKFLGIPDKFSWEQVFTFVNYWEGRPTVTHQGDWEGKFMNHVRHNWQKSKSNPAPKQSEAEILEGMTNTDWAEGVL